MNSKPANLTPFVFPPKLVDVSGIERELARLWSEPHPKSDAPQNVTRAVMSNLLIYCASPEQAEPVPLEIATIVLQHPCRALLLVGDSKGPGNDIAAQVSAHCQFVGGGRQVCSEHVTVSATGDAVRRLPSAARSLLLGDIPTSLWWATPEPPPEGGSLFEELAVMADQVIYESMGWLDPVRCMIATANWAGGEATGQRIADLSWRKLKPWRRIISQALDPTVVGDAQQAIVEVEMEHGPHGLPQAWLLTSWLVRRLGWEATGGKVKAGVEIDWMFRSPRNPVKITIRRLPQGEPLVRKISISWPINGKKTTAHFVVAQPGRYIVTWDDETIRPRSLVWPAESRADLIARQLPDLDRNLLFRQTLQVCKGMAEALP